MQANSDLIKMSELSKRTGVSGATIRYYIKEGLLPPPAEKTSKNMAYYDISMVEKVKAIKELQSSRFLPLKVIKDMISEVSFSRDENQTDELIIQILEKRSESKRKTREELLNEGIAEIEIDNYLKLGIITPDLDQGVQYFNDYDVDLIYLLDKARKSGIDASMLPTSILLAYVNALREMMRLELQMFRKSVVPRATNNLQEITENAVDLSEELIITLRRKLLVPMLEELKAF